jgi:hypothetical protein
MVVSTPDGPVQVTLGDDASVQRLVPADRADLAPGQRVAIDGARDGDGAVAASGVQIVGQGSGAGGQDAGAGSRQPGQGPGSVGPRAAGPAGAP